MTDHLAGSIGSIISVNCGNEGYYSGRLSAFCPAKKTITLDRPLKDGVPVGHPVTLSGSQISGLKVLKTAAEVLKQVIAPPPPPTLQPMQLLLQVGGVSSSSTPQAVVAPLKMQKPIDLAELEAEYLKPAIKPVERKSTQGDQSDTTSRGATEKRQARFDEKQQQPSQQQQQQNSQQQQQQWVSRPLAVPQQQQRQPGGGGGGRRRQRRRSDDLPAYSSARSSPTNDEGDEEDDATSLGNIAPTPLFRKYEPQVAQPTILEPRRAHSNRAAKRQAGPSGIPALDAARGRVTGRSSELNRPLDHDLLDTDFDFQTNLDLFNKETDADDDFYETVEKPKMSVNYAHYENIIDDPARCTSWTNMTAKHAYSEYESEAPEEEEPQLQQRRPSAAAAAGTAAGSAKKVSPSHKPKLQQVQVQPVQPEDRRSSCTARRIVVSHFAECEEAGLRLPVLDEKEKARLAKETRAFLGEDAHSLILADRVLEWIFHVIASQGILVERVALLCAHSTAQSLLDRILMQLTARGCRVSLYGAHLEKALPLVELVASERDLPSDVQMIVDLDPSMQRKSRSAELTRWMDGLREAHLICLDHICPGVEDLDRMHALMVGALSTSVMETIRKASKVVPKVGPTSVAELFGATAAVAKQGRPHIGLADLGVPFAWFGDEAANALSALFATTFVAPCNLQ